MLTLLMSLERIVGELSRLESFAAKIIILQVRARIEHTNGFFGNITLALKDINVFAIPTVNNKLLVIVSEISFVILWALNIARFGWECSECVNVSPIVIRSKLVLAVKPIPQKRILSVRK